MPVVVDTQTPQNEKDLWRTNTALFRLLDERFRFHLDAAASAENALCAHYYTEEDNALVQPWYRPDDGIWRVFCNPPFSMFDQFLAKGNVECDKGALCVFLVRADALETAWWTDNIVVKTANNKGAPKHHVRILVPRVPYLLPDGKKSKNPQFATAVVLMMNPALQGAYLSHYEPRISWWWWKDAAKEKGYL